MNIEAIIQGNTSSITELTEAIIKLTEALSKGDSRPVIKDIGVPVKALNNDLTVTPLSVEYPTVKALIGSLALNHRDEIKELNKKYQLSVFADLLIDKNDATKGVNDTDKLVHYYEDLLKLEV